MSYKSAKSYILAAVLMTALVCVQGCSTGSAGKTVKKWFGFGSSSEESYTLDDPQGLALDAQDKMDASDYKGAAEIYKQLKDQYPYSKYAILAELKLGDALYMGDKFIEAQGAYEDFERLHPENDAVPYAIYQQGMTHYMRMKGIDRDQTPAILTIQTMARLIETFPGSEYASMGRARILEAQNNLAGHEFYVGEFYFKRKDYAAAMNRFKGLIQFYPDSGHHQKALNYIAEYNTLVADGEIKEDENIRSQEYDSPFKSTFITE